tara:strand:+ start:1210 stop:2775 length:1566 start_codon:yes stop_codon:yes gene_type:complete
VSDEGKQLELFNLADEAPVEPPKHILKKPSTKFLSKTRFMAGLQCDKRLYLESYYSDFRDPIGESLQALFNSGHRVGALARERFPGGKLIDVPLRNGKAHDLTVAAMSDETIDSIYEGVFTFDEINVRPDILKRVGKNEFDMIEVKSSTRVKREHIPDISVQVYVLEGTGVKIRKAGILVLNTGYVYEGGDYDLQKLFSLHDVTDRSRAWLEDVFKERLSHQKNVLSEDEMPIVKIGPHCTRPYQCSFYSFCRENVPETHIENMPYLKADVFNVLQEQGIDLIHDIPQEFENLNLVQKRVRNSVVTGEPYMDAALKGQIDSLSYPIHFIDFEAFNPALPVYINSRPYEVFPFQWSLHMLDERGNLSHYSHLCEGSKDPSLEFVETLLASVHQIGSVVVYSNYEKTRLDKLADRFPSLRPAIYQLIDRLFDLYLVVSKNYYHPDFRGSFALKSVAPVLAPDLSYDQLEVKEGSHAALVYSSIVSGSISGQEREEAIDALEQYCKVDTEGLVRIVDSFKKNLG